jgi:hypothetical protein
MCSSTWVYGRWMLFFCNGFHEKYVEQPPHLPSRYMHLILCTTNFTKLTIFLLKRQSPNGKHKGTLLPWSLNVNDLFVEAISFSLLCHFLGQVIFFMYQVMLWIPQCTWILIGMIFSFFMLKHTLHKLVTCS